MMRRLSAVLIAAVTLLAGAASAHHSYAATYDTSKDVKLEGKLVQFVYRNPHTFVHVQAMDESGAMQRWAIEWAGTSQLDRAGVSRDTLKIGDKVVITGNPGRNPADHRLRMRSIERPKDGWKWSGTFQ